MTDKKIIVQFTVLTFCIAYLVSGALIALGQFGYSVHNWVHSLQQFGMNIPFAIYILSPAIASYIVLKKNNKIADFQEWLKTVFYAKNNISLYLFVVAGLALYFLIHIAVSGRMEMVLPFYMFFHSPGNYYVLSLFCRFLIVGIFMHNITHNGKIIFFPSLNIAKNFLIITIQII
ncbi:MAG: hypothetical protein K0R92_504 [Lachnospiraceae bacterium]|jgi:hypothetical protein|nr:hypothetical protein [Lachnospiraceae bacterium]